MSSTAGRPLTARALRRLLSELGEQPVQRTLQLPGGSTYRELESETGWVVIVAADEEVLIAPPLPLDERFEREGFDSGMLEDQLNARPTVGIILVRLGRYAVGVFRGHELIVSKTETRYVGSQHRAGGWSQKRFARIREKQMRELFDKVCEVGHEKLSAYEGKIERLWLGGDRHVLNGFISRCPWLERFAKRTASRRLNVPTPDLDGLKDSVDQALSYRVVRLPRGPAAP